MNSNFPSGRGIEAAVEDHTDSPFRVGRVFFFLVLLTFATFASLFIRQNFSNVWSHTTNVLFVLLVATAKASLVILFFMHWKYEKRWKFVLCIPTILLAIIAVIALLPDIAFESYERSSWHGP